MPLIKVKAGEEEVSDEPSHEIYGFHAVYYRKVSFINTHKWGVKQV